MNPKQKRKVQRQARETVHAGLHAAFKSGKTYMMRLSAGKPAAPKGKENVQAAPKARVNEVF